jgi:diguanylate cyclase (GGDEF)-like protein
MMSEGLPEAAVTPLAVPQGRCFVCVPVEANALPHRVLRIACHGRDLGPESAYGREEAMMEAETAGISAFLVKPVDAGVLLDTIANLFDGDTRPASSAATAPAAADALPQVTSELRGARVLLVEDNETNREVAVEALGDAGLVVEVAENGRIACDKVHAADGAGFDAVLMDVQMPDMDGYEVCRQIKADSLLADVPIIFTTALGAPEAEVRGLELGAIDYVTKPVSPVIVQAHVRNHIEMKQMRDQLAKLAVTDALTGLGNRRRLEKTLNQKVSRLVRTGAQLSIIILDIDFFKRFNDSYGHTAGGRCITMVGGTLSRALRRAGDLAVRYGGEEFACVLLDADHEEAMNVAQDIRDRIRAIGIPHNKSDAAPYVTDPPPLKWSVLRYGFEPEEDRDGEHEAPA